MKAYVKRLFGAHQQNTVHEPTNEYSAIVDEAYYHDLYKNEMPASMTAAEHFFTTGWKEGKDPCLFFQTKWYCEHYPDIEKTGVNPLRTIACVVDANVNGVVITSAPFGKPIAAIIFSNAK